MIKNIALRNFRGFQDEVSVRVRPITVLIGRNSAGKSSLIKFLLMLRQTLESQRDDFFVTDGRYVQLGSWRDLRNTRTKGSRDSNFRYSIEVETNDLPDKAIQQLWKQVGQKNVVLDLGEKYRLILDLDKYPVTHESPVGSFDISGRVPYGKRFRQGRHEVTGSIGGERIYRKLSTNLENTGFLRFSRRTDSLSDMIESAASEQFLERLRYEFTSLRHLSPIREESLETIQVGNPPPMDVGDKGEYAIPHLARIFHSGAHNDQLEFIGEFASRVIDVEKITFKSQVANISTQVEARNRQTQAINYLADFGFGVSQCLPIFIQGVMHDPQQLLIVEQPEAQLHPTAQLELGSFFAELWRQREVPTIIETHSANILLRLRRLIKREVLCPRDVTVAFFTIEEVPQRGGRSSPVVVVKNLDIQPDGSLEKGLPMEFFGADVIEAIDMGA